MSFKKDGSDPTTARPSISFTWIGAVAAALGLIPDKQAQNRKEQDRYLHEYRGKRPQQKTKHRRNMLTVSKRVRRKHRRAA